MPDDYVQVTGSDGVVRKIDNTSETTGAGVVDRQRVTVANAVTDEALLLECRAIRYGIELLLQQYGLDLNLREAVNAG